MAEGEKKVVEMNVWFVILLVVIIIATAWIMSLYTKIGEANTRIADLEKSVTTLQSENSNRASLILDLAKMANDGNLSKNALLKKIEDAGLDINNLPTQQPEVVESGDVISGEVTE